MAHAGVHCKECKWWNALEVERDGVQMGECRRYPPSVLPTGLVYHSFSELSRKGFPTSSEDCWCGEFHY